MGTRVVEVEDVDAPKSMKKANKCKPEVDESEDDEDYSPPKRSRPNEPASPCKVYNENGEEIEEETEYGTQLVCVNASKL